MLVCVGYQIWTCELEMGLTYIDVKKSETT